MSIYLQFINVVTSVWVHSQLRYLERRLYIHVLMVDDAALVFLYPFKEEQVETVLSIRNKMK